MSVFSFKFVSQKARILRKFDLRKDSQVIKLENSNIDKAKLRNVRGSKYFWFTHL